MYKIVFQIELTKIICKIFQSWIFENKILNQKDTLLRLNYQYLGIPYTHKVYKNIKILWNKIY